jgi:hypothetical protein
MTVLSRSHLETPLENSVQISSVAESGFESDLFDAVSGIFEVLARQTDTL